MTRAGERTGREGRSGDGHAIRFSLVVMSRGSVPTVVVRGAVLVVTTVALLVVTMVMHAVLQ